MQALLKTTLIVALLSLLGCTSSRIATHPLRLADMDPLEYVAHLESHEAGDDCEYSHEVFGGWVKQKHLPHLFELLDSYRRCALPVHIAASPHVAMGKGSTVGREAAFLIMNFQGERYPARLDSRVSDQEKEALRAWWEQYRRKKE